MASWISVWGSNYTKVEQIYLYITIIKRAIHNSMHLGIRVLNPIHTGISSKHYMVNTTFYEMFDKFQKFLHISIITITITITIITTIIIIIIIIICVESVIASQVNRQYYEIFIFKITEEIADTLAVQLVRLIANIRDSQLLQGVNNCFYFILNTIKLELRRRPMLYLCIKIFNLLTQLLEKSQIVLFSTLKDKDVFPKKSIQVFMI